jgi:DNA-binding CsgD family transcriptional regulator
MSKLRQDHFAALSQALLRVHAPMDVATFQRESIAALRGLIDNDCISYNEFEGERLFLLNEPYIFDAESLQIFGVHIADHPVISHITATGDQGAFRLTDFLSRNQWRRTALYNEVFRPRRFTSQLSCGFDAGATKITYALNRGRRDFTEEERLLLDLAGPHLTAAYRKAVILARIGMDQPGVAEIILGPDLRIERTSTGAERLLEAYFPRAAKFPEPLRQWVAGQTAGEPRVRKPPCLRVHGSRGTLSVNLSMASTDGRVHLLLEEHAPSRLTAREAEILHWLAEGKRNAEIATILGISAATVKTHVERILGKLGVESRAAAAAWVRKFELGT